MLGPAPIAGWFLASHALVEKETAREGKVSFKSHRQPRGTLACTLKERASLSNRQMRTLPHTSADNIGNKHLHLSANRAFSRHY